jgi:Tfp pilus assembly protein PilX
MMNSRKKNPRRRMEMVRDEAGLAMIIVMAIVLLLTLIPLALFTQSLQQLPLARHDQDHESALAAAEAGVDDYLNRLNQNSNYWTYNAANLPSDGNGAFTGFVPVAGPTPNRESFRYRPDVSTTPSTGIIYLTSTGKSRNVMRTVRAGIRRQGFLDFLYLTDLEIVDPALSGDPSDCQMHAWEKNPSGGYGPNTGNCDYIVWWTDAAALNGPVHTNDALYVCGSPDFNGDTDTYYNSPTSQSVSGTTSFGGPGALKTKSGCVNSPFFNRNNDPASGANLPFPPANLSIKTQADGSVGGLGCLYTGPTTITLHNSGNVGQMDVVSPLTKVTNTGPLPKSSCGPGNNLSLPANGVVYVQTVPSSSSNPNYGACTGAGCNGDVKVSGTLAGQLTIAAENDVIITGNTVYHQYPGGTDVLGLVANNNVSINHPVNSSGVNQSGSITDPTVDAAIMAIDHSFFVQNWTRGDPLGELTINGVITQEYRGAVGTFTGTPPVMNHGYDKNYTYDTRLKYLSPPYFLSPTQSAWQRISYSELKPTATP